MSTWTETNSPSQLAVRHVMFHNLITHTRTVAMQEYPLLCKQSSKPLTTTTHHTNLPPLMMPCLPWPIISPTPYPPPTPCPCPPGPSIPIGIMPPTPPGPFGPLTSSPAFSASILSTLNSAVRSYSFAVAIASSCTLLLASTWLARRTRSTRSTRASRLPRLIMDVSSTSMLASSVLKADASAERVTCENGMKYW